jgi:hypothetical protein
MAHPLAALRSAARGLVDIGVLASIILKVSMTEISGPAPAGPARPCHSTP